ncbi:MAG TPA: UbiX family flavin prenyltransferase [Planctomycetota bacterium]|nr:UbiX family flavin prenyltransferase [Planctomycetota bacterium]
MKPWAADGRSERPVVIGVTGASGSVYARRIVRYLLEHGHDVLLTLSKAGRLVLAEELDLRGEEDPWGSVNRDRLWIYPEKDFGAPFCSGSFRFRGMAVVPASMGTIGAIAHGISANIIHRGADVAIKERLPLVLVPREAPFSEIHLENLLKLSRAGAIVVPPSPAFYQKPRTLEDVIDFVVSRVLDALGIENDLFHRWGT